MDKLAILLVATVGLMIGGIDIYLPALPYLVTYFQSTAEFMQLTISVSPLISAVVSFVWGRQADLRSHKRLMLLSLFLFGSGALVCAGSSNQWIFLAGRIIQSIGGSGLSNLTIIILYDVFRSEKKRAYYVALYGAMFPVVFALSPILGALFFKHLGWRSCFFFVTFMSGVFYFGYMSLLKTNRHKKDKPSENSFLRLKDLVQNKYFMTLCLGHSLPVGISMLFTANATFILQNFYKLEPMTYSVVQSLPIILNFIGAFYYRYLLKRTTMDKTISIAGYSVSAFVIGLMALLFSENHSVIALIFVMGIFTFYMSFSISSCAVRAIDSQPQDRGLAVALISTCRNGFGSLIVITSSFFYTSTPDPMYCSMLLTAIPLALILLVVYPSFKHHQS